MKTLEEVPLWTLEDALNLVRSTQEALTPIGWYIGLTGSVLFKGESYKDLDLIFYPKTTANIDTDALLKTLKDSGFNPWLSMDQIHAIWRSIGSNDTKNVSSWKYQGKRVDVFILS